MTPDQFLTLIKPPIVWKRVGWNNNHDEETDEITAYGYVFDDRVSKIIRIVFMLSSERWMVVERINGKKYKTVFNKRTVEELNEFLRTNYTA